MSQNPKHEKSAKELDELLKQGAKDCNNPETKPFLQTARALERESRTDDEKIDRSVAHKQRSALISMAEKMKGKSEKPASSKLPAFGSWLRGPWYVWAGSLATVAAVLIIATVLVNPGSTPRLTGLFADRAQEIGRILIPEANAADAFTFAAEKRGADGVDTTTAFIVTSKVALSASELKQHLEIVPADSSDVNAKPPAVTVADLGGGKFKVTPEEPLTPGKVYRIEIPVAVAHQDGTQTNKDFTWAVQTRNVFRVTSTVPADHVSFVPVNTGIEFTFNQQDWEDPAAHFSISPAVEGRFETHGRSLAFVPAKPLAYGQLYTVTLKKGLKLKASESALEQDVVLRFETQSEVQAKAQAKNQKPKPTVNPSYEYNQAVPGKDILLPVYWSDEELKQVEVTGFQLNRDQAKSYLEERGKVPEYAVETKRRVSDYSKYSKQKTWNFKGALERNSYYSFSLRLPNTIGVGDYLVRIDTPGAESTWTFLEVSKVLTYSIADKNTLLVWAMNAETERPLADLAVAHGSAQARTGSDGIARLPVPSILASTDTNAGTGAVITLGEGELSSVLWIPKGTRMYYDSWNSWITDQNDKTLAYIYNDRPLYRTSDKLYAYGLVRDRDSGKTPSDLTLELTKSGYYWDYFSGNQKVYARVQLTPDEQGFYRSELDWSQLVPGYYTVELKREGKRVALRTFEVKDFVKPAYTIDLAFDKQEIFAGETITGEARVTFFDGTPVADMKLRASASSPDLSSDQLITTDADGRASFSFKTKLWDCSIKDSETWFYCNSTNNVYVSVAPTDGEEARISAAGNVTLWRSHVSLDAYVQTERDKAHLTFKAHRVDLSRPTVESDTVLAEPVRNGNVTGRIVERTWKAIPTGTYYDYRNKVTYPTYRYEMQSREVGKINVTTDAAGNAAFDFTIPSSTASYQAIVSMKDENGAEDYAVRYFAYNAYSRVSADYMTPPSNPGQEDTSIYFQPPAADQERGGYDVGDKVKLAFYQGKNELRPAATPIYLYVKAQRGIRDAIVSDKPTYEFDFTQQSIPNVSVRGVIFRDGGFFERSYGVGIEQSKRELNITVTPDQASYAPGGKAKLHVSLKTKDGRPAADARLVLGVVDEALYAAGNEWLGGTPDPLSAIYAWVSDGIIVDYASLNAENAEFGMGGAERGGGGGEGVRRNFKDTAAFITLTADAQGQADILVDLPDNITSWRANLVAIAPDLHAGQTRLNIKVTKPLFVDAVAPSPVLSSDQPVLKLRSFGTAFKGHEPVSFTVDAPTLGLENEKVEGKAFEPMYVAIKKLVPGVHALTLRVTSSKGTDAIEKKITVLDSRFTKLEKVQVELGPGATLPDLGTTREIDLVFLPLSRVQYLDDVRSLTYTWSDRLEALYAKELAKKLLKEQFNQKVDDASVSLTRFQKPSGGLSILAYSSEDPEVTAKIAAIDPSFFDRVSMQGYFTDILQRKDTSREEQLRALSGLAALGSPVLQQLQDMSAIKDLNWREKLAVMRGLDSLGDQAGAQVMLEALLKTGEERDGSLSLKVAEDKRSNYEATAEAAAVAADLVHPAAPKLAKWLETNWAHDAFTVLDKIAYLRKVVPAASARDVTVGYAFGNTQKSVTLKSGWGESVKLTAAEAKDFRITSVDGPAVGVFNRQAPGAPQATSEISIERHYETADKKTTTEFSENQPVYVKLKVSWKETAQSGCYTLRDYLPANMAPLVEITYFQGGADAGLWYPSDVGDGAVSFSLCKTKLPQEIMYKARVISRGTYSAETPIVQSDVTPSYAALGKQDTILVK